MKRTMLLICALAVAGCSTAPLKGGKATTSPAPGGSVQTLAQGDNPAAVSRQEDHVASRESSGEKFIRRRAERGFHLQPFLVGEAFNVIQAAAADHTKHSFAHGKSRLLEKRRFVSLERGRAIGFTGRELDPRGTAVELGGKRGAGPRQRPGPSGFI